MFFKRSYKRRDIPLEIYELVEITEKIKKHSDVYNFKSYRTSLCGDKLFFHFCFRLSITNLSSKQEKGKENSSKKWTIYGMYPPSALHSFSGKLSSLFELRYPPVSKFKTLRTGRAQVCKTLVTNLSVPLPLLLIPNIRLWKWT